MSDLRSLIKKSKAGRKELIPTTIRLPKEINLFVEDLAELLGISKQEAFVKLIEEGVEIAERELEHEELISSNFYVLNTNKRHSENDQEFMLSSKVAAAHYDPWKFNINRIKKGDYVFLYENGVGIIAYGRGSGETKMKDYDGDKDECHYQELSDLVILDEPISATRVKEILERNVVFLRTMSAIPDGFKIIEAIK